MLWKFYDQGNANVLFYNVDDNSKLLRLRKNSKGFSTEYIHQFWLEEVQPRLHRFCITQQLVKLDTAFLNDLRAVNPGVEFDYSSLGGLYVPRIGPFAPKSISEFIPHCLMPCLIHHKNYIDCCRYTIQFKPKWLLQSPNAPPQARGCRNCALYLKRHGKTPKFCPLDLASSDPDRVRRAFTSLLDPHNLSNLADVLSAFWLEADLCSHLIQLQSLDKVGILAYGPSSVVPNDLKLAMSARDCTIYLDVISSKDGNCLDSVLDTVLDNTDLESKADYSGIALNGVEYLVCAKVGDVDPKPDNKQSYWYNLEASLDYCADQLTCMT